MDDNNLKINIAALSRKYKVDKRTINILIVLKKEDEKQNIKTRQILQTN